MEARYTVRTVVTLMTALCVATMFTGSVAALGLSDVGDTVNVGDEADQSPIDVELGVGGEQSDSGGSGTGTVAVESNHGNASGASTIGADVEEGLTVELSGEGDSQGQALNGSLACNISPDETNPGDACNYTMPGADDSPVNPGEDLPINPGDNASENPGENLPISPGDESPVNPGEELPISPGNNSSINPGEHLPISPGDESPVNPGEKLPISPGGGELPPEIGDLFAL